MELGIYIRSGVTFKGMLDLTLHAEKLGYFGVFLNDHVHGFADNGKESYLEAWTAMTGIGVKTSKIRIGHIVLFNNLRNPAFLAKSISALDNMTNGRYELLIGAGWNSPEYEGYDLMEQGRGMPDAGERVERFEEALHILRGMLTKEEFSFEGKYWILKNAYNVPLPIQKSMRITVGADKPRMIGLTAKLADGLNTGGGLDSLSKKIDLLDSSAKKYGKTKDDYFISGFSGFQIAKNHEEYNNLAKKASKGSKKSVEEIKENAFIGTPEILVDKLRKASDLGVKMIVIAPRPYNNLDEFKNNLNILHDKIKSQL